MADAYVLIKAAPIASAECPVKSLASSPTSREFGVMVPARFAERPGIGDDVEPGELPGRAPDGVGARVARTWQLDPGGTDPQQVTGWLRPSFAYEFPGEPVIAFSWAAVPFDSDYSGPSLIFNAGLDADLTRHVALYANADYEVQFDGLGESIGAQVGLKVRW